MNYLAKVTIGECPCSQSKIEEIKKLTGNYSLPAAYVEFLECAGNDGYGPGSAEVTLYKKDAPLLLELDGFPLKLGAEDFVFFMSQGCMFTFFKMTDGDDPPVFSYFETQKSPFFYKETDTFSDFLYKFYHDSGALFKNWKNIESKEI